MILRKLDITTSSGPPGSQTIRISKTIVLRVPATKSLIYTVIQLSMAGPEQNQLSSEQDRDDSETPEAVSKPK